MPTIILRHVTKSFRRGKHSPKKPPDNAHTPHKTPTPYALDGLSLTVRDGETLAILGPSGCGKTTLLRVIAGLVKPNAGEILYDGAPLSEIPMPERGIGMVFQNYALYPHLPAQENIGFYDMLRGQPERIPERIRTIVQVMGVDLRHLLSRKPPTLSGGEKQRVAVARCLARDPKLFLFDEPLSNLDAKLRNETRVQIKRLLRHYRITSVYVTHDQQEAVALADRIAIMRAGRIEQTGDFRALYDTPKNAFVAQFFGTPPMNLFGGHVYGQTWEGRGFSVQPIRPGLQQGQAVYLGIRPERVEMATDGIPARVEYSEPIFPSRQQLLHLDMHGQPCVAAVPLGEPAQTGQTVYLRFPAEHLYFFDQKSGVRIG